MSTLGRYRQFLQHKISLLLTELVENKKSLMRDLKLKVQNAARHYDSHKSNIH